MTGRSVAQPPADPSAYGTRVRRVLSVVRRRPFDTSTEQGRSNERFRRAALTALASGGARCVSVLTTLIAVPLTIDYLGSERYGLWMTISSVVAMLAFADFGIGNGLINAVSEAYARDDRGAAGRYVSSAFFSLLAVAALLLLVFAAVYPFVPWPRVFKVTSETAAREAGPAMAVFVVCLALNVVTGIVPRIQSAHQEGAASAVWQSAGNLAALVALVAAVRARLGLPWLVFALAGVPALALVANGVVFCAKRPWLRPARRAVTRPAVRHILRLGALFFVLQVAVAVGFSSDNFVAAQVLGAEAVTEYSVPFRLFGIPMLLIGLLMTPLWPAYVEAIARGDRAWIRRTLRRSLGLAVGVSSLAALFLVLLGPQVLRLWVGGHVTPSRMLLLGLGVWTVMNAAGQAIAALFNGARVMRFQVWSALSMAVTNIVLSVILARQVGLPGIIWGTVISYGVCCVVPWFFFVPRLLNRLEAPPAAAPGSAFAR